MPGESRHVVVTDSDEHDEEGHITEDAETRVRMTQKRLHQKHSLLRAEIRPPFFSGSRNPEIVVMGWGSTYGVIREAVDLLSADNGNIAMLHFSEICPFPSVEVFDYLSLLQKVRLSMCIENNATGQFARLLRSETGFAVHSSINKYNGRPFSVQEIIRGIREESRRL